MQNLKKFISVNMESSIKPDLSFTVTGYNPAFDRLRVERCILVKNNVQCCLNQLILLYSNKLVYFADVNEDLRAKRIRNYDRLINCIQLCYTRSYYIGVIEKAPGFILIKSNKERCSINIVACA